MVNHFVFDKSLSTTFQQNIPDIKWKTPAQW